jgi:ubiquinone/menaquinone biosynthesis C-methylase UbiE
MSRSLGTGVCPAWLAWVLNNPLRRRLHQPEAIIGGLVVPGLTVVDLGCGSGPFTVALAQMVGPSGRVIAADLQPAMLAKVQKRVARAGLQDRVQLHPCAPDRVGLSARADFVLAFWMVHEVPSAAALFEEMHEALNPGGKLLLVEPRLHVARRVFEDEVDAAQRAKFMLLARPEIRLSSAALFAK